MTYCSGMDSRAIEEAKSYYEWMLMDLATAYNAYHNYIYQILCILGVFANICIIVVLLRPAMRKNPFNLFLIAIAICDMTLMASYFLYKQVEICNPLYFSYSWIVFTYMYAVLSVFVHSASLWITVNMAVLRYFVLRASTLSSSGPKLNSYRSTSVAIAAAIIISLAGSTPNSLRYRIHDGGMLKVPNICLYNGSQYTNHYKKNQLVHAYTLGQPTFWNCSWERLSFWTAGLLLKIIPCLLLTVFMMLLIRTLVEAHERRSRLTKRCGTPTSTSENRRQSMGSGMKSQAERTTAMLTTIVAVFLLTELPQGILVLAIGIQPKVKFAMHQLGNIIDLLSLLNSSVNFILYSTMSNLFRNEFLNTFGNCCQYFYRIFSGTKQTNKDVDFDTMKRLSNVESNNTKIDSFGKNTYRSRNRASDITTLELRMEDKNTVEGLISFLDEERL